MSTATRQRFDPTSPRHLADPHPLLRRMREQAPVYRFSPPSGGPGVWYLTRYRDVQRALLDPNLGRQATRLPPELAAVHLRLEADPLAMVRRNVFNLDPPDHTRLRRLIAPAFSARSVAQVGRHIREVVDALIADIAGCTAPVDVIEALALPLPSLVVADLVGFPIDDRALLRQWSDAMLRSHDPLRVRRAGGEFIAYIRDKIAERRSAPGDDLLSALIEAERSGGLSRTELISSVFQLVLAGDETSVNLVGNATLELLRHPDQLALLRKRPELLDQAVEEVIRFNGPVGYSRPLYALADTPIGSSLVPQGEVVVPMLLAANRDPAQFPDPDVFDIERTGGRHLGFGHGIHFCLGAAIARRQARIAIEALVLGFPGLALAVPPEELGWTPDLFLHGVTRLPVLLHADRGGTGNP